MKSDLKQSYSLDPRTKICLLFLCVFAALLAPSLKYELCLVVMICLLGIYQRVTRYALISFLIYFLIYKATAILMQINGNFQVALIAFLGLVHKVYPCGILSGIIISTTRVSEFITAMYKIHIPQKVVIPLAVMLRYLPTIKEDMGYIKDAMHLRDVSPSFLGFLKNPLFTTECIYVPLMMRALQTANELTVASITRGIENPVKRTSFVQLGFHIRDIIIVICFIVLTFYILYKGVI